jgi:Protein of unknown function (DUF3108)
MMFHSRAAQTTLLATGSALVLLLAALDDHAHAEGNLDANYTISFARIRVGDITATVVFGDNEYAISARGRAGSVMKVLVDGEASFTTRGTVKDGHPAPTTFTSKIISNTEILDVTMVLDEGGVKELAAGPQPGGDRVPVTEANRQGIVDPLTAMFFSAVAAGDGLSPEACRQTLPIFDGHHRYDLKLRFKRMDEVDGRKRIRGAGGGVFRRLRTNSRPSPVDPPCQISFRRSRNGGCARTGRRHAPAGAVSGIGRDHVCKSSDRSQPVRSDCATTWRFNGF